MAFEELRRVTDAMVGFPRPWCVAGGWAIALLVGREVRTRGDVELAVFREDSLALRDWLDEWTLIADHGSVKSAWEKGDAAPAAVHTAFGTSPDGVRATIRVLDSGHGLWFSSRNRMITLPVGALRRFSPDDLPYLVPEAALLGLAPGAGEGEHQDMRAALPFLDGMAKIWLDRALAMTIPDHPWRTVLTPPRPAPPQDTSEE